MKKLLLLTFLSASVFAATPGSRTTAQLQAEIDLVSAQIVVAQKQAAMQIQNLNQRLDDLKAQLKKAK